MNNLSFPIWVSFRAVAGASMLCHQGARLPLEGFLALISHVILVPP